jgi:hypothetical protein
MRAAEMVQGSLHVQRREDGTGVSRPSAHAQGEEDSDRSIDQPPRTPPPSVPAEAPGGTVQAPASARGQAAKRSPPSRKRHAQTPDRMRLRGLEDSLAETDGPDDSLNISMLSSSMTSVSAAPTSALMLTMGKMRKKEGHGIMAKESPVNCWIEDNFLVVSAEGDQRAEKWDLGQCKVVPPHKLDRIKLQMTSSTGLRELSLHAHSKLEAQQWLRTIVSRQEIIRVQSECHAVLKRVQDVHDRKQRQLSHQIEILSRSCEVWEDECDGLTRKIDQLEEEVSHLRSTCQDLTSNHDTCVAQKQALEEEVREAQIRVAAHAAHEEENREEANAQVEAVLEQCQELQRQLNARQSKEEPIPEADYFQEVQGGLQRAADMADALESQLQECSNRAQLSMAHQLQTIQVQELAGLVAQNASSISANPRSVAVVQDGDVGGFCKIPLQEFDLMKQRLLKQQRRLDDLADLDASVRHECQETMMVLEEMRAKRAAAASPFLIAMPLTGMHPLVFGPLTGDRTRILGEGSNQSESQRSGPFSF